MIVKRLFEPTAPVHDELKKYDVEWVDSAFPCYFHTDPKTVVREPRPVVRKSKSVNFSDKQIVQNVCLKFIGWDGLICVSKGDDKLYLCNVRHYSNGRPIGFLFAAYKNKGFVEELIADYWKAEGEELSVA